jgi:prolyl oligopeptidase
MLRYQHFTVGQHLTAEFGNADASQDEFATLQAYSPLHNVREGVAYPSVLVTTADHDDRAVPLHAMKFIAALQAADPQGAPHLLRVERDAGHGIGKPASRLLEEMADTLAFLSWALQADDPHLVHVARL